MSAPLCRYCRKPLDKHTDTVTFGGYYRNDANRPYCTSRKEAQRHLNHQIVSVKWCLEPIRRADGCIIGDTGKRVIYMAGIWDGESYGINGEGLFCSKRCGYELGRHMAKQGWQMQKREAVA